MVTDYMNSPWFQALSDEVKSSSGSAVARKIGRSPALVSTVLKGTYNGNIDNVQELIEGALMNRSVTCPVLDEIPTNLCQDNRSRGFSAANPMRLRLFKTCKQCEHNPNKED